jgi:DtxR family Mn-dependent transcriptional regulator
MNLSESAEEILELLHTSIERKGESSFDIDDISIELDSDALKDLSTLNLVVLSEGQVALTPTGRVEAENVIRRHRLAERLLVDILNVDIAHVEEAACKFEHVIKNGIEDNICILLGHPRFCPHGNSIPKGECCTTVQNKAERVVVALSELEPNREAKIAYIHTHEQRTLQKLIAMGITPGMQVSLIQKYPTYVFQIGHGQFAVDEEIANKIFVLKTSS